MFIPQEQTVSPGGPATPLLESPSACKQWAPISPTQQTSAEWCRVVESPALKLEPALSGRTSTRHDMPWRLYVSAHLPCRTSISTLTSVYYVGKHMLASWCSSFRPCFAAVLTMPQLWWAMKQPPDICHHLARLVDLILLPLRGVNPLLAHS
jgi:hypothetical protein